MRVFLGVVLGLLLAGFAYENELLIPHQTVPQVTAKVRGMLPPSLGGTNSRQNAGLSQ